MEIDLVDLIKSRDEGGIVLLKDEYSGLMHILLLGFCLTQMTLRSALAIFILKCGNQ